MATKIVNIDVKEGDAGLLYATSKEVPGLLVAHEDLDALLAAVPGVIEEMHSLSGKNVRVLEIERTGDEKRSYPWAMVPESDIEKRAC